MERQLTPRGEQRRAELLAYATRQFASKGYHPTSVAELVDGLGVGKGVFYWYFDSKEQLFLEILRTGERELRQFQWEAMGNEAHPLRRLELAIRGSMAWWSEHRDLYTLIEFARTESSFAADVRKGEKTALSDTERLVDSAMETGAVPLGNSAVTAQAILGVTAVLARTQLIRRNRPAEEVAEEAIDFCLHGLLGARTKAAAAS
jgi:AcrR family transcriptional regulator